jgi:hypothetical protein
VGLGEFVGSIGVGVKHFFSIPECQVCKLREQTELKFERLYENRIRELQDNLDIERDEKRHLQSLVEKLMRLPQPSTTQAVQLPKIHGVVSPMRQRQTREANSRQDYWKKKAEKVEDINANREGQVQP